MLVTPTACSEGAGADGGLARAASSCCATQDEEDRWFTTCSGSSSKCVDDAWEQKACSVTDALPPTLAQLVAQRWNLQHKDPKQHSKQAALHSPALALGRGVACVGSSLAISPPGLEEAFWQSSSRFLVRLDSIVLLGWLLSMMRVLPQNLAAAHSFWVTMAVLALQVVHVACASAGGRWYARWREHVAIVMQLAKVGVFMRTWAQRDLSAPEHSATFTIEFVLLWCTLVQVMFLSALSIVIRFRWRAPMQMLLLAYAITKCAPGAAALLRLPRLYTPLAAAGARACARLQWAANLVASTTGAAGSMLQPSLQWSCAVPAASSSGNGLLLLVVALQLLVGFLATLAFL